MSQFSVSLCFYLFHLCLAKFEMESPTIVREPPMHVNFYNTTGTIIPCVTKSTPLPEVRWTSSDGIAVKDIPGLRHVRSDGSLVFPPFPAEKYRQDVHSAVYRCVASNVLGVIGSRNVNVRGVIFQTYEARVYDEFVIYGNTAVIRCQVPSYVRDYLTVITWSRDDGFVITPQHNFTIETKFVLFPSGELHVRNVGHEDSHAKFRCRVKNSITGKNMESINTGKLVVTEPHTSVPPRITHSSRYVYVKQGDTALLPCAAQGYPTPSYKWQKRDKGQLLYVALDRRIEQVDGTLIVSRAEIFDSGIYICTARNDMGETKFELQLTVRVPLRAAIWPRHQKVSSGTSVSFNCTTTGHPITNMEWMKNQRPVVSNRRITISGNVIHINSVQRENIGIYQCYIYNEEESAQASTYLSIASESPRIILKFEEDTYNPGDHISLRCSAAGNPLPQITWFTYGIPVQDTGRLRVGDYVSRDGIVISYVNISATEIADGGIYECKATNDYGTDSHSATVYIRGPPYIKPMRNRTVIAGQTLILHCPISGHPIKSVRWERGIKQLPLGRRQKVHSNGTLVIHHVDGKEDDGQYQCRATNDQGLAASRKVYIKVLVPPKITPFSFPENAEEGMRASVSCSVPVGDPPISILWLKDGLPISTDVRISLELIDDFVSTLVFKSLTQEHSGTYTCVASNDAATVNFTVPLSVSAAPKWKIEPIDKSAVVGHSLLLDCMAIGRPEPRVVWKRAEESSSIEYRTVISGSRVQSLVNGSLYFREIEQEDDGRYMCEASNGVGSALSTVVKLTVNVPAYFKQKFQASVIQKGQSTELKCEAFGERPVSFVWMKDRQLIDSSTPSIVLQEQLLKESQISELRFISTRRQDTALYTCMASNPYGQDETSIQLTVLDKPDPPKDIEAYDIHGRSISLKWNKPYNGNNPITRYIVEYKESTGDWSNAEREIYVDGDQTKVNIPHLIPLVRYNFRLSSENRLGRSQFSEILTVITDGEAPGGSPVKVHATPIGSSRLHVTWQAPVSILHYGLLKGYHVGYKAYNAPDDTPFTYKTVEEVESYEKSCEIRNLKRATKYRIVVQAFNDRGAGPHSDEVIVQTLEFDPPQTPSLKVDSVTSSTILLIWESIFDNENPVSGFIINWRKDGDEWTELQLSRDQISHLLTGLKCGTNYQFFITSYNNVGKGEPSDIVSGRTEGSAPIAPTTQSWINRNATSIILRLSSWRNGGCPIEFFVVQYKPQRQQEWILISSQIHSDQEKVVISDLAPGTWYNILVSAHNVVGVKEADYLVSTLTVTGATVQPDNLTDPSRRYRSLSFIVPICCAAVVLVAVSVAVFLLICRKRSPRMTNLYEGVRHSEDPKTDALAMGELEKTYDQNRESIYFPTPYATSNIPFAGRDDGRVDGDRCRSLNRPNIRGNEHLYDIPQPLRDDIKHEKHDKSKQNREYEEGDARYGFTDVMHHDRPHSTPSASCAQYSKILNGNRWSIPESNDRWQSIKEEIPVTHHPLLVDGSELSDAECDREYKFSSGNGMKTTVLLQSNW
ncbi:cell adhesion molecule Dscam1-like isoform X1 [Centruroides vittatus]|uniref:cell adhesion molecule Dscam1-like isoform X1 n=2 Tax=Centruroides vittatus TaxID=120091 RepID=UPI0035105162